MLIMIAMVVAMVFMVMIMTMIVVMAAAALSQVQLQFHGTDQACLRAPEDLVVPLRMLVLLVIQKLIH